MQFNVKQHPNSKKSPHLLFFNREEMLHSSIIENYKCKKPAFNKLNEFTYFDNPKFIFIRIYTHTNLYDKHTKNFQ